MDKRIYNCVFCVKNEECDLEQRKDHAYNLRDGKADCFVSHGETVPPWLNPFCDKCYGCTNYTYDDCSVCEKDNTSLNNYGLAKTHHPKSQELYKFISNLDFNNGDYFTFKSGGDGDNGEFLMDLFDVYFKEKVN